MGKIKLTTNPVSKEYHPTKNVLPVDEVSIASGRKVWWVCDAAHEYEMAVYSRTGKHSAGCPYCAGQKVLVGFNDLVTTHPEIAMQWHPEKNGDLKNTDVSKGSNKKVWWLGSCGHEYEARIPGRTLNHIGCPYCAGQKVLVGFNDLATTHPEIAMQWHPTKNGDLKNTDVSKGSNKKVWWLCSRNHEWETTTNKRTSGRGCPVCAGKKVISGFNDIGTTHPEKSVTWNSDRNMLLSPFDIVAGSHKRVWWLCENGHEWEASVANRLLNNGTGTGCPSCLSVSKNEQELFTFLRTLLPDEVVFQSDRKILTGKELDIWLPEKNIAIEFNGIYWHSEPMGKSKSYHYDKWKQCKKQGIQLIQIWEDDWNRNRALLERMLSYKLGINLYGKYYARKLSVVKVSADTAREFLTLNHLQGYRTAKYFGLKIGEENLVSVVGVQRKGGEGLEIIRFASSAQVPGGFSKLLNYVLQQPEYVNVKKVYSYSHNDYSDGGVYKANGFTLVHEGVPGYSYISYSNPVVRMNRLAYSPSAVKRNPNLKYVEGASERELAELNGLIRVWDSGSSLWVKEL